MNESILQQFNYCVSCYFIAFFTVFLTLFMSSPSSHKKLESPLAKTWFHLFHFQNSLPFNFGTAKAIQWHIKSNEYENWKKVVGVFRISILQ